MRQANSTNNSTNNVQIIMQTNITSCRSATQLQSIPIAPHIEFSDTLYAQFAPTCVLPSLSRQTATPVAFGDLASQVPAFRGEMIHRSLQVRFRAVAILKRREKRPPSNVCSCSRSPNRTSHILTAGAARRKAQPRTSPRRSRKLASGEDSACLIAKT